MTYEDRLDQLLDGFSEKIHDLTYEVQDMADEKQYRDYLAKLKILQGSPLFNMLVRSTSKEYVRKFGE